jgi:4-methyl-5(b-hydroxyethyl)-thiazole monophosphate biosynthesis
MMKRKIFVFLADGFEEIEALTIVDVLRRAGQEVVMVSVTPNEIVVGAHQVSLLCDKNFVDCDFYEQPSMLVLPGGPGTEMLAAHEGLCKLLKEYMAKDFPVAAICAAPSVLGRLDLVEGRQVVCYPGYEKFMKGAKVLDRQAVTDGNLITGRGPGAATDFSLAIVEYLAGKTVANNLAKAMCVLH